MTLTSAAVEQLESHMPKVVDARTHGIIDYCHAAFFFGMAWLWRKNQPRAATAALLTGGFILVESMLTDYPLGVKKVIPFETHGRMDAAFAGASFMVPKVFGFEGTTASKVFTGNGFAESAVVGMTDWNSEHAREEEHDGKFAIAS
ncbi:MAG TPA: hypothetical protein VGL22_15310 [Terracidiphilus sp.]|jgi:hypothetical protein